eukprot:946825-Prorocentrum_minimum.AAC.2
MESVTRTPNLPRIESAADPSLVNSEIIRSETRPQSSRVVAHQLKGSSSVGAAFDASAWSSPARTQCVIAGEGLVTLR